MRNFNRNYANPFGEEMPPRPPHELFHGPMGHIPPHLRRPIDFDESEWEILNIAMHQAFSDEASVGAAGIIQERAPQEIQIILYQLSRMIAAVAARLDHETEKQTDNSEADLAEYAVPPFKFSIIDHETQKLYAELYGDRAGDFIEALLPVPDEIAEASKMAACLEKMLLAMMKGE